jgi:hypothetical protein
MEPINWRNKMNDFHQQSPEDTELPVPEMAGQLYDTAPIMKSSSENAVVPESRGSMNKINATLQFAEEKHQYLREYISAADQKAFFFFTINSSLLAFLNTKDASSHFLKLSPWTISDLVTFIAVVGLMISAIFFLWVITPRLKGSKRGLIFFSAIAEYATKGEYINAVQKLSETSILTEKLQHCYELAKICNTKHSVFVWGQYIFFVSIICAFIFLLLK